MAVVCWPLCVFGQEELPKPHPLERYRPLWEWPLFASDLASALENPPPLAAPMPPAHRLLGVGTVHGNEIAYIAEANGGRIQQVTRDPGAALVLLKVERSPQGRITAIQFRSGSVILRAEAAAAGMESVPPSFRVETGSAPAFRNVEDVM